MVPTAHTFQLAAASRVFEKQILDHPDMSAGHQLAVHSPDGTTKRRAAVVCGGVERPGQPTGSGRALHAPAPGTIFNHTFTVSSQRLD